MRILLGIATSTFFGCGAGIMLYGSNSTLQPTAYLSVIPFWPLVVFPTGIFWYQKVLKVINAGQFPPEMISYREMFLSSRKAMVYDLFLNQLGYHSLVGIAFLTYVYWTRKLYDKEVKCKNYFNFLSSSLFGLMKLRVLFGVVSILSQFWSSKLFLQKNGDNYSISSIGKRQLLLKETFLNLFWMTSVAKLAHDKYPQEH